MTKPLNHPVTLAALPAHQPARVVGLVAAHAEPGLLARLGELGFLPGEYLTLLRRGPGGREPIAVQIGDSIFALRLMEADCVQVAAVAADTPGLPAQEVAA